MIIGHTDCGVQSINSDKIMEAMKSRGVSEEQINMIRYCGINFESWLGGFDDVFSAVHNTVDMIEHHLFIPKDICVYGFVMDSVTGELNLAE